MRKPENRFRDSAKPCRFATPILGLLLIGVVVAVPITLKAVSISGSAITIGQGYQDVAGDDHFNLAQGLRLNAYSLGVKDLSFHGYFQYYGDLKDDFADDGMLRLYHGYLRYSNAKCPLTVRAGRFFLFRGVAVGVLDGGEATYRINSRWSVTGFGGVQGPLSREWEFNPGGNSPMFGGEIRWIPKKIAGIKPALAISYTRQERDGNLIRHLAGLSLNLKLNRNWNTLNIVHLNLDGSLLRKALTRWRYTGQKIQFSTEAAIIRPYTTAYSYFSDFEMESNILRLRNTTEYHLVPRQWGMGLSTLYFNTTEYGFRTGPYVIFPFGRIGYHHSWGDQPNNNVFWGYVRVSPWSYLDLYTYAATMEYEWEAMDIDSQETTILNAGFKVRPPTSKRTEFGLELQNYTTPELETDRRLIVNFQWNFDCQRKP